MVTRRVRARGPAATMASALCILVLTLSTLSPPGVVAAELSRLHVQDDRLVDASGRPVVLHGVNRSGTEYMCAQDRGITDGPMDQSSVAAIRSWRANAVRVPLNEHCWLGIDDGAATPQYVGEPYRQTIADYVDLLAANGLYAILDLRWSAPAGQAADRQRPMPNTSYSVEFWTSVASRFKDHGRVLFDLYNEAVPNNNENDATDDAARRSWECWRDGGTASCDATLSLSIPGTAMSASETVGMRALVDAVRATGATNVILLGGIQWANTLWSSETRNWLTYRPGDPAGNLAAAVHIYPWTWCANVSCYEAEIAPIAARAPVVAGEFGIVGCDSATTTWLTTLLSWLDGRQAGYLAWTWGTPHSGHDPCSVIKLLLTFDGTPTIYGEVYRTHLAGLPVETRATLSSSAAPAREGEALTFAATVAAEFGSDVPGGSVVIAIDGQHGESVALDSAGRASMSTVFTDDGVHAVVARYPGAAGFASSTSAVLTQRIENVAPAVGAIAGPLDPVSVGTSLSVAASFTDPGTADSHSATVDWGDGTVSSATVTGTSGSGTAIADHSYNAAGIYRPIGTVTDDDGGIGTSALDAVVIFDPAAGSARGAGWFESPRGAHAWEEATTGRAIFGFLARYRTDATEPVAHPGFRLRTERFVFESTSYEWLVIAGAKAQLRGLGRVDGSGSYGFFMSAADAPTSGVERDRLRIKIWDDTTGSVLYDSQMGAPDAADPVTDLAGGSITIGLGAG